MALQIRRGLANQRTAVTPAEGELLYTTDSKLVYVGDGTTAGGNLLAGGSGINNVVEDTTPQLGGNLDVNGRSIVSTNNQNIVLQAGGTGSILLNSTVSGANRLTLAPTSTNYVTLPAITTIGDPTSGIDGSLAVVTNTYTTATGAGLSFGQHHASAAPIPTLLYRSRGTGTVPAAVQLNDRLGSLAFAGHDGTNYITSASISVAITGAVGPNSVPTKIALATHNGTSVAIRAELSEFGVWRTNSITALTADQNLAIFANGTGSVGLDGTLFKASTMTMPTLANEPTGTAGKMAVCDGTTWDGGGDGLQHLMIYINNAWTVVV
jgi:hypothetical protein